MSRWPKAVLQFEDFEMQHALTLLERYRKHHLVFNDDIQVGQRLAKPGQSHHGQQGFLQNDTSDAIALTHSHRLMTYSHSQQWSAAGTLPCHSG